MRAPARATKVLFRRSLLLASAVAVLSATAGSRAEPDSEKPAAGGGRASGGAGGRSAGPECPSELTRHLSAPVVRRTCKKAQKSFVRTQVVDGACRYVFRSEQNEEADHRDEGGEADRPGRVPFVEIRASTEAEPPARPDETFYSWRKVGKAYVTYKANVARAQPWFDTATTLWLADESSVVTVTVATALCTRAEAERLARDLR